MGERYSVKKFLKILVYAVGGTLLFLVLLATITQTQFFRDRLRAAALSNLNAILDADISLGELHGNLVTGFSIDSIAVRSKGEAVFTARRVDLRYSLLEIPGRTISVRAVTIVNPVIRLVRPAGERWNFARIIRPTAPDTVPARPFDWVLRIDRLAVESGSLWLVDSTALTDPAHDRGDTSDIEYHDIALKDLNLSLSAEIQEKVKHIDISSMSFVSEHPGFHLTKFSGDCTVTPSEVRVKALTIVTSRSEIHLDASMSKVDLLGGPSLVGMRQCPVNLGLQAQDINFDEMKKFLPPLHFLHGPVSVDMSASGEFGDLQVHRLNVRFGHSELKLKGSVQNLHDPRNLNLDVRVTDGVVEPGDPLALMPDFNLPDFSEMGKFRLALQFQGTPRDFHTKTEIGTDAGDVNSDVALVIGGPSVLNYKGRVDFRNLDISRMLGDESLDSRLTGGVRLVGEGVSLAALNASAQVDIDSSTFRGQPLRDTHVTLTGSDRTLQTKAYLHLGSMISTLGFGISQNDAGPTSFETDGDVRMMHIGSFLRDPDNDHVVSFRYRAKGSGLTLATVGGDLDCDFSYWREADSSSSNGTLHLAIDQSDTLNRSVNIESTMGSLDLTGQYDLASLGRLIAYHVRSASRSLHERFAFLDTSMSAEPRVSIPQPGRDVLTPDGWIDAKFVVHVEDLAPLSIFVQSWDGLGQAQCSGAITGSRDGLSIRGHAAVNEYAYGRVEGGTLIEGGDLQFNLLHVKPPGSVDSVAMDMRGSFTSLHINEYGLDSVQAELVYGANSATYAISSVLNGEIRLRSRGSATIVGDTVTVNIESLHCSYFDYEWDAGSGVQVRFGRGGIAVSNLALHRGDEEVLVDAGVGPGGTLTGLINARRLDLEGLKYLLKKDEIHSMGGSFAGVADVHISVSGTLDSPLFEASLSADHIAYRTVPLGVMKGTFSYRDQSLGVRLNLDAEENTGRTAPELIVSGTIPVDLAFAKVRERTADKPMDLTVRSDSLEIGVLDPLLPTFEQLRGTMTCDVTVRGTPRRPEYEGELRIRNCSFLFVPNNITYLFDGTFQPQGERIKVVDAVIRNVASDEAVGQKGALHISGDFLLADFKPGDFDLSATGQLLVVKEATGESALSVYGRLFVEIGRGGLRFTGSIDQSLLRGDVLVRNSSLIFPPTRTLRQQQSELSVPMSPVNDTVRVQPEPHSVASRYFGGNGSRTGGRGSSSLLPTKSFIDGVRYDLDIETAGGNTSIRMIFNPGEELDATIDGKFSITEDGRRWFGDLTIESATYNYLKRFNADGKISFTGDFANPGLDITATYEGTRKIRDTTSAMEMTEPVVVTIKITGTRYVPKLAMSMEIADQDYASYAASHYGLTSNDVQSDAIQFILSGAFPLTTSQRNDVASSMPSSVGSSLLTGASSMLTGAFSDFLRTQTGFINSVELNYGSGDNVGQRTDIRLSGSAFNGLWRYGGRILNDPFSNANFSLLYSFGTIFNDPTLRNLMFELERRVQDVTIGQTNTTRGVNSARMFYRFSF